MGHVAEGPQPFVGESVVIPLLLFRRHPDAPDIIGGIVRRNTDVPAPVHDLAVCGAAAVRDPDA